MLLDAWAGWLARTRACVCGFRRDGKDLAKLMRELSTLEGLHWIRILYAYPSYFNDELIDEIANNPKVRAARMHAYVQGALCALARQPA